MELSTFLQMFVNGTMIGSQLALFATGLTLVYGIMLIINFAHGELYMLGAFAVFFFAEQLGLNYFISLILAMIVVSCRKTFPNSAVRRVTTTGVMRNNEIIPSGELNCTPPWCNLRRLIVTEGVFRY